MISRALRKTNLPLVSRFAVLALLVVLVAAALYLYAEVMLPFVLAALLAYVLAPVVSAMHRLHVRGWHLHRGLAILIIYAVFFAAMYLTGRFIAPSLAAEVNRIVNELPRMMVQVEQEWIVPAERELNVWLAEFAPPADPADVPDTAFAPNGASGDGQANGRQAAATPDGAVADGATANGTPPQPGEPQPMPESTVAAPQRPFWEALVRDYTYVVRPLDGGRFEVVPRPREASQAEQEEVHSLSVNRQMTAAFQDFRERLEGNFFELIEFGRRHLSRVLNSFFTTFLVFMIAAFILADPSRTHGFLRALVPPAYQGKFDELLVQLDRGLSGVVRGQLTICVVNGFLTAVGLFVLDVPFAITLTLIATVLSLIPIFGVLLSSVPIVLMALSVSFTTAVLMLLWIAVIHFIEGNFLNPKIMGDAARIHPVLVIFALLVGQYTGGVIGALIAVPIFSVVQTGFLYLKSLAENWETAA